MRDSRWFKEGQQAFNDGMMLSDCVYGARSAKALIWVEGFNAAELLDTQSGVHCTAHVDYDVDSPTPVA